jgi:hypothetical protein
VRGRGAAMKYLSHKASRECAISMTDSSITHRD